MHITNKHTTADYVDELMDISVPLLFHSTQLFSDSSTTFGVT